MNPPFLRRSWSNKSNRPSVPRVAIASRSDLGAWRERGLRLVRANTIGQPPAATAGRPDHLAQRGRRFPGPAWEANRLDLADLRPLLSDQVDRPAAAFERVVLRHDKVTS